jgi:hypothetical protein
MKMSLLYCAVCGAKSFLEDALFDQQKLFLCTSCFKHKDVWLEWIGWFNEERTFAIAMENWEYVIQLNKLIEGMNNEMKEFHLIKLNKSGNMVI